jgi:hypothetical protein
MHEITYLEFICVISKSKYMLIIIWLILSNAVWLINPKQIIIIRILFYENILYIHDTILKNKF